MSQPISAPLFTSLRRTSTLAALLVHPTLNAIQQDRTTLMSETDLTDRAPEPPPIELSETVLRTEKMASLGELVTGVAHEINNPVNFIHGNLGYADRYMQDLLHLVSLYRQFYPETHPNTPIEITQQIEQMDLDFVMEDFPKIQASMRLGASRIYEIVQSLRTFSHSDDAQPQAFDLHDGIESTLIILNNRLKGKGDRPTIEVEKQFSTLPPIHCYAGRINQVVMNLVSNAIDAIDTQMSQPLSPQKSRDWVPCITIATQILEAGWVTLSIRDNGCGMDPKTQSQIFNPFFTTKGIHQGTGMGLAICQQIIVQDHQGILECESMPETGTVFTIRLPIVQEG